MSPANPHRQLPRSLKPRPIRPVLWRAQEPKVTLECQCCPVRGYDLTPLKEEIRDNGFAGFCKPQHIEIVMGFVRARYPDARTWLHCDPSGHDTLIITWTQSTRVPVRLSPKIQKFLNLPTSPATLLETGTARTSQKAAAWGTPPQRL